MTATRLTIPKLYFSIIHSPKPEYCDGNSWLEIAKTLTKDGEVVQAIENYLTPLGKKKLDNSFSGHYHCEAMMCSLLFAAKTSSQNAATQTPAGINDVLQTLRGAKPMIGASKRCCHVCRTIMVFLGQHHDQQIPILDGHSTINPYVLPPLLPQDVRRQVIDHYRDELRKVLIEITIDYKEDRAKAVTFPSCMSPDSQAVSSDSERRNSSNDRL
jgi:hypothetical protein